MVIPMRGDVTEVMSMLMRRSNKRSMSMRISISISISMIMMLAMIYTGADAWTSAPTTKSATLTSRFRRNPTSPTTTRRLLVIVHQAGFGSSATNKKTASPSSSASSSSSSPAAATSVIKLKPKQQWDRYLDLLKKETPVPVAVRVTKPNSSASASTPSSSWLAVGYVKSVDSAWTEVAVAKQRALIAEHAKRLFPLQISIKDRVEWGYGTATATTTTPTTTDETNQETTYTVVDVKAVDQRNDLPSSIEKMIGFQGSPDPKTGYYCVYNEGRIVTGSGNSDFTSNKKGTSKKLS